MSAQEIIAELPAKSAGIGDSGRETPRIANLAKSRVAITSWRSALLEVAGTAEGLPADLARDSREDWSLTDCISFTVMAERGVMDP